MPHLKRMLDREGYSLQQWWCGLPSSTPAVQGGLMYGNNWNIPAFRWYEKQSGKTLVAKHPRDARILQDRLSAGRRGLLQGGSSYVNIYDGGARLSLFTVSALGGERFFENVRGVGFATLLLLSPLRLLRLIGDSAWDFTSDLIKRLASRVAPQAGTHPRPVSPLAALFQIVASVVFRELQTFGVLRHSKRRVYRRNGVQEYLVLLTLEEEVVWFFLEDGEYNRLVPDDQGVLRSRVFPGLWLHLEHFWNGTLPGLMDTLQQGLASQEHVDFAAKLAQQSP